MSVFGTKPNSAAPLDDERIHIIEAAMDLVAKRGWTSVDMLQIADAADVPYGRLCQLYASKAAIVEGFSSYIDAQLAEQVDIDAEEPARDRLFEVLMDRFELLRDYRPALSAISHDMGHDLQALPMVWGSISNSMGQALSLAGIQPTALLRTAQTQTLVALYGKVSRVFMTDQSADLGATMKALDQEMGEAEQWANTLNEVVEVLGNPSKWMGGLDRMAAKASRRYRQRTKSSAQSSAQSKGPSGAADASSSPSPAPTASTQHPDTQGTIIDIQPSHDEAE